jgi:hypothetical protein
MYRTESKQRAEILLPVPLQLLIVTTFNVCFWLNVTCIQMAASVLTLHKIVHGSTVL